MEICKIMSGGMETASGHLLLTLPSPVRKKRASSETGCGSFEAKATVCCGNLCLSMRWVLEGDGGPREAWGQTDREKEYYKCYYTN